MNGGAEDDPEEAGRVYKAVIAATRDKLDALRAAPPPGSFDHQFVRRDPATFDATDHEILRRLIWHYRRRVPGWMRPRMNPDDPLVRAQQDSAHV